MKKINEITDFLSLSNDLKACEEVNDKEAVKVKCCWLQLELCKHYDLWHNVEMEEAYKWIRTKPVAEWNVMLECIMHSGCLTLEEAKDLYSSLW